MKVRLTREQLERTIQARIVCYEERNVAGSFKNRRVPIPEIIECEVESEDILKAFLSLMSHLWILGTKYAVLAEADVDTLSNMDRFNPHEARIRIKPMLPPSMQFAVLWHATIDSVLWKLCDDEIDNRTVEQLTSALGQAIVSFLHENPYLREGPS